MKAAVYDAFEGPVEIRKVDDQRPGDSGILRRVAVAGVCSSDWHGRMGHDPGIS